MPCARAMRSLSTAWRPSRAIAVTSAPPARGGGAGRGGAGGAGPGGGGGGRGGGGDGLDGVAGGPRLQAGDAVLDVVAGREDADRDVDALVAQAAHDADAVEVGHRHVEH